MTNTRLAPDQVRITETKKLSDHLSDLAVSSARLYLDTATALLDTVDTNFFKVPESGGDRLYYNNAGVAEDQNIVFPTTTYLTQGIASTSSEASSTLTSRTAAETARDLAIAAAASSETIYPYATYALANSDKANRPLNSYVQVAVDETRSNRKTAYKVTTGPVLTFQIYLDQSGLDDFEYLPVSSGIMSRNVGTRIGAIPRSKPSMSLDFGSSPAKYSISGSEVNLSDLITYTGVPNRTHFNAQGKLVGVDFTTGSFVNNTDVGRNVFNTVLADDLLQITLDSDADNHRDWVVSKKVRLSQESNGANYVNGTVESYVSSTQVLILRVTATGVGAVNPALLKLSNLEIRDATYNPSTGERLGLLVEPAATQLVVDNRDFTSGGWSGTATLTTHPGRDIGGDIGGTQFSGSGTNRAWTGAFTNGQVVTFSVVAERDGASGLLPRIQINNTAAFPDSPMMEYDFATDTINFVTGSAAGLNAVHAQRLGPNRCRFGFTDTAQAAGNLQVRLIAPSTGFVVYDFPQVEVGAAPTSIIPTRTVSVTRAADDADISAAAVTQLGLGRGFSGVMEYVPAGGLSGRLLTVRESGSEYIELRTGPTQSAQLVAESSGGLVSLNNSVAYTAGDTIRVAFRAFLDNYAISTQASAVLTDTSDTVPTAPTAIKFGRDVTNGNRVPLTISNFRIYPTPVNDAELQVTSEV